MTSSDTESLDFAGLRIAFDQRVLRPRPWTEAQSLWARELLDSLPPGSVLELCCGAAQIGLGATAGTSRELVCVDADPVAARFATGNAAAAGMADRVQVLVGRFEETLRPDESFPLIIADPPWVPSADTARFPDDPLSAIDGGIDGLEVARSCLRLIEHHLSDTGVALLQLGSSEQVDRLLAHRPGPLEAAEVRHYRRGVVARLVRHTSHATRHTPHATRMRSTP